MQKFIIYLNLYQLHHIIREEDGEDDEEKKIKTIIIAIY